jgi:hypothetical protein
VALEPDRQRPGGVSAPDRTVVSKHQNPRLRQAAGRGRSVSR